MIMESPLLPLESSLLAASDASSPIVEDSTKTNGVWKGQSAIYLNILI